MKPRPHEFIGPIVDFVMGLCQGRNLALGVYPNSLFKLSVYENTGYTAFGSDAPFIKTKKLTGTTAGAAGGSVSSTVAHGVNPQKILAVSLIINTVDYLFLENANSGTASATYLINGPNIIVLNKSGASSNIYNMPFTLYITYEE